MAVELGPLWCFYPAEELETIAAEEGFELSDEALDDIAGGEQPWICIRDWSCSTQTIKPDPPIV